MGRAFSHADLFAFFLSRWQTFSAAASFWGRVGGLASLSRQAETQSSRGPRTTLCSLAESQLQMQAARSVALDTSALGVMTVDAAVAAIVIGTRGAYELWVLALALLGLSFGLAVRGGRPSGADRTGPLIDDVLEASETGKDDQLERSLLRDLATDMRINRRTLARKGLLLDRAQTFLVVAILVELVGRGVQ